MGSVEADLYVNIRVDMLRELDEREGVDVVDHQHSADTRGTAESGHVDRQCFFDVEHEAGGECCVRGGRGGVGGRVEHDPNGDRPVVGQLHRMESEVPCGGPAAHAGEVS